MTNGTMTMQWTVWCSDCCKWDTVSGSKKFAISEFKTDGWERHKGIWKCSSCAMKIKGHKPIADSTDQPK